MGGLFQGAAEVMAEQCTGRGARGVVVAAAPMAAAIGASALRDGGNAFDAVVAAALAETVLLPPKCGLGGDLVALVLSPDEAEPRALLAIGGAPRRLAGVARAGELRVTGPTSVGPPGAPAGYVALAGHGRLPLERLAAPAAALARDGFPWAPICTVLATEARSLVERENPGGTAYFPDGRVLAPGEIVRLPGLALVLDELVSRRAAFLDGPVGDAVVAAVRARGGVLEDGDLAYATAELVPASRGRAGDRTVWATPAPTHGPSLIDAMSEAAPGDGAGRTWDRVTAAVARRRSSLGDVRAQAGTSAVSAADADGTVVVVVHSNSFPRFGSGIVVDGFDLVLANRAGRGFTPVEGHPNFPLPGRRPATTLHAWAVGRGRPALVGATPGGANQMPWNAQALTEVVSGTDDPGRLVTSPRWEWLPEDDGVRIEDGFDRAAVEELSARAGRVEHVGRWGLRSAQQVVAVPRRGAAVVAAVDPRTGGAAVGV